jgi:hypothetical protein
MSEEDDVIVQGDVDETMQSEEERKLIEKEDKEEIQAPFAASAPKKSKTPKKTKSMNKNDTTIIASITKQLGRQTAAIDKVGQMLQSLQKDVKPLERHRKAIRIDKTGSIPDKAATKTDIAS